MERQHRRAGPGPATVHATGTGTVWRVAGRPLWCQTADCLRHADARCWLCLHGTRSFTLAALPILPAIRAGRHPVRPTAHRTGGQTGTGAPASTLLRHPDDAGQCRRRGRSLAGLLALQFDFRWVGLAGTAMFVLAALVNALLLPPYRVATGKHHPGNPCAWFCKTAATCALY
jgi:hypothetical protein